MLKFLLNLIRPRCPACNGDGGAVTGYYEPEFSECDYCNGDGEQNYIDGPARVWLWDWMLHPYREWREARRLKAWVEAEVSRERDLRCGENPAMWR